MHLEMRSNFSETSDLVTISELTHLAFSGRQSLCKLGRSASEGEVDRHPRQTHLNAHMRHKLASMLALASRVESMIRDVIVLTQRCDMRCPVAPAS